MIVGTLSISIHAPPRGATRACVQTQRRLQTISIHAPPRGATTAGIFDATRRPYFNSRPSARGDDGLHTLFERLPDFNSRPSARGDIAALVAFRHVEDFNSRPSARGDREFVHGAARVGISIHAPPRGATGSSVVSYYQVKHFNSRPSARGDSEKQIKFAADLRFQFTPLREGRPRPSVPHISTMEISIHAPPRGATVRDGTVSGRRDYFNSRPSARGDDGFHRVRAKRIISIHAPPRGATYGVQVRAMRHEDISIHAPPRGAT